MDGSKCPENGNSTDCLLRNILQFLNNSQAVDAAKPEYELWNLYVTIVVGVIASYIALGSSLERVYIRSASIYRKCNRSTIGKWFSLNRLRWNLATMNFQVTANTPVLGTAFLQEWKRQQSLVSKHEGHASLPQRQKRFKPEAAWCEFLEEIGLDGVDPERMNVGNALRPVLVDHLPDDLAAPPAYAQIGFIAAAVASKGVQVRSFDSKSGESTFISPAFRFDLRQHATLGLVGVYLRHQPKDTEVPPLWGDIRNNMDYGRGIIGVKTRKTMASYGEKSAQTEVIHLLDGMNRNQISDSLSGSSAIFSRYPDCFWPQESSLPKDLLLIFSLFFCTTPETVPGLFPVSALKTKHPLTILALNGNYWANARLGDFSASTFSPETNFSEVPQWKNVSWCANAKSLMDIKVDFGGNFCEIRRQIEDEFRVTKIATPDCAPSVLSATPGNTEDVTAAPGPTNELNGDVIHDQKVYRGSKTVLRICLKLLHNPDELEDWFSKASPWTREYLRLLSLEQLRQVDESIEETSHGAQDEDHCRVATLTANSMILYKAIEVLDFDEGNAKDSKATAKNGDTEQQESDEDHPVRDSPRGRHCDLLSALRDLLTTFNRNTNTTEVLAETRKPNEEGLSDEHKSAEFRGAIDDPFDLQSFSRKNKKHRRWLSHLSGGPPVTGDQVSNTNEVLRRLGRIVVNNMESADDWPLRGQFSGERDHGGMRDLDDMVIYRCLILVLLFRTAQDSTELLRSGMWEHVIPIL